MDQIFRGGIFDRDALPTAMTQLVHRPLEVTTWATFTQQSLPARGGAVGSWNSTPGDPLAEVLIVRDEDYLETMTWLNAYFSGFAPVTQWCRILSSSQAERIAKRSRDVSLERMLGAWVGAVLAECSVQAGGVQNLRDVPGSAAASCATFAAGRAFAVWNGESDFGELARRHDELSKSLRDAARPISANVMIPFWCVIGGFRDGAYADRRAIHPLSDILASIANQVNEVETAELVRRISIEASELFKLPEFIGCSHGPQVDRVRALDLLGERLMQGPRSPAIDGLLGLGASFIDPGATVSPELLRRYGHELPLAPIWQGAFAGAMAPVRVMTDQSGLGRLVAKSLLAVDDLHGRPSCDIAYDELIRWITPGRPLKLDVRGMSARVLSVELVPGVTCAFSYGRTEQTSKTVAREEPARPQITDRSKPVSGRSLQEIDFVVADLQKQLEYLMTQLMDAQANLNLLEPQSGKKTKSGRYSPPKSR